MKDDAGMRALVPPCGAVSSDWSYYPVYAVVIGSFGRLV